MDYFKSLSSAASSVLSSARSGPLPNFTIGQEHIEYRTQTLWSLYSAVKRDDNSQCTVLAFDLAHPHNANRSSLLQLAKNAARKLRTVRHPDVLKLLDSAESNTAVYIAVEKAIPLHKVLAQSQDKRATPQRQNWITWGLSSILNAVKFLNNDAASTHGNIRPETIFVSASGEWKLGGFDALTAHAEAPHGLLFSHGSFIPDAARYAPPEVKQNGWNVLASMDSTLLDSYSLALVAIEAFNGPLPPQSSNAAPPRGHVPADLYAALQRMLVPNAKNRMTVAKVQEAGESDGGFFKENTLVKVARGLDGFLLATENEKSSIIKLLQDKPDSFTPDFLMYKVLPTLVGALSWVPPPGTIASASTQPSVLLPLVLTLGQPLPQDEWNAGVVPPLLKAYASPDRSTRMVLLENLPLYAERMDSKTVVDKLWPNLVNGFNDSVPLIREATLKAILPLAPKLSDRILNNDLLRVLARIQVDPEAGIRTNTTILLGRLVPHLSLATRKKVLIPAFARSLKDQFVHARVAGLMALMATGESFDHEDAARQILPAVVPCMVDREKLVRDQADKAVKLFLETVEKGRVGMPNSALTPEQLNNATSFSSSDSLGAEGANGSASYATSMAASAGSAASALAGWAMSSALSSLSSSTTSTSVPPGKPLSSAAELQSNMDGRSTPSLSASTTTSTIAGVATPPSSQLQSQSQHRTSSALSPPTSGLSGIRLGSGHLGDDDDDSSSWQPASTSASASASANPLDYDLEDDAPTASTASAFSMAPPATTSLEDRDLMDVYDDSADWASFEVGKPKKKPASVGKTKMARAKLGPQAATKRSTSASSSLSMGKKLGLAQNNVPDPKQAIARSSLQVAAPVEPVEDTAWGEEWESSNQAGAADQTSATRTADTSSAPQDTLSPVPASGGDSMSASQELTAQAFSSPLPAPVSSAETDIDKEQAQVQDNWTSFNDASYEDDDEGTHTPPVATSTPPPPTTQALTKEEKKAELERKRNERRLRLEQLKREKEAARLKALPS
ncbi:hypothetical protein BCV70DRAFT_200734 [Testicularia cyperi]|uniref:Protein kinase domain-containing protein n=1 Tax=Testicularia cyperi TaxID=1882483 RepID=A0A317XNF3_9BASI|nr:hypothetical protein BCV70DRAFT_200734 [Testicularia cyperi]